MNKEAHELYWGKDSPVPPKTKQKVLVLLNSKEFKKDVKNLRTKWKEEIERIRQNFDQELASDQNSKFWKDLNSLCAKHKFFPTRLWDSSMFSYVLNNYFAFPTRSFIGGKPIPSIETKEDKIIFPKFFIFHDKDPDTNQSRLFIQVFENTTLKDLKRAYGRIHKTMKERKELLGIKKHEYPLKNLSKEIKVLKTPKKDYTYFEPTQDKEIKSKMTDLDIALKIFGEKFIEKEGEKKAKDMIKQLRHRAKKRLK